MSLKFAFNVQWIVSINALPTFSMHLSPICMKLACNLPPLEWMNVSTENWSHWQYSGRKESLLLENWQKFLKSALIKNSFLNLLKFLQNLGKFGNHPNKSLHGTQWVIALLFVPSFCVVLVQHDQSPIYLWRKVVFLGVMRSTELRCFRLCSWCLCKALTEEGCMGMSLSLETSHSKGNNKA